MLAGQPRLQQGNTQHPYVSMPKKFRVYQPNSRQLTQPKVPTGVSEMTSRREYPSQWASQTPSPKGIGANPGPLTRARLCPKWPIMAPLLLRASSHPRVMVRR